MRKVINWLVIPTNVKLLVNAFIIIVGGMSAIIGMMPDSLMHPEIKLFILNATGIMVGMFKGLEKMTMNDNNEWKKTSE